MKPMKHDNPDFEKLVMCAGQDPKRPAYKVVYSDNKEGYLISTDGKRLYGTKSLPLAQEEGAYDIRCYAEQGVFEKAKTTFPRWEFLIEQDFKYYLEMDVPPFVEKLNPKMKSAEALVTLVPECTLAPYNVALTLDAEDTRDPEKFTFNLALLQPFAGQRIQLFVPRDGHSHALMVGPDIVLDEIRAKAMPWFLAIVASRPDKELSKMLVTL